MSWQGFLKGEYVEIKAGDLVTASMDVVEASSAEEAAKKGASGNGSNPALTSALKS